MKHIAWGLILGLAHINLAQAANVLNCTSPDGAAFTLDQNSTAVKSHLVAFKQGANSAQFKYALDQGTLVVGTVDHCGRAGCWPKLTSTQAKFVNHENAQETYYQCK